MAILCNDINVFLIFSNKIDSFYGFSIFLYFEFPVCFVVTSGTKESLNSTTRGFLHPQLYYRASRVDSRSDLITIHPSLAYNSLSNMERNVLLVSLHLKTLGFKPIIHSLYVYINIRTSNWCKS